MTFNLEVTIPDSEIMVNGITDRIAAYTSWSLIEKYWKSFGVNVQGKLYADFDQTKIS